MTLKRYCTARLPPIEDATVVRSILLMVIFEFPPFAIETCSHNALLQPGIVASKFYFHNYFLIHELKAGRSIRRLNFRPRLFPFVRDADHGGRGSLAAARPCGNG